MCGTAASAPHFKNTCHTASSRHAFHTCASGLCTLHGGGGEPLRIAGCHRDARGAAVCQHAAGLGRAEAGRTVSRREQDLQCSRWALGMLSQNWSAACRGSAQEMAVQAAGLDRLAPQHTRKHAPRLRAGGWVHALAIHASLLCCAHEVGPVFGLAPSCKTRPDQTPGNSTISRPGSHTLVPT